MKKISSLSIFFPAYNEEENIETTVREALSVAAELTDAYEVIIINDGSKDQTGAIADQLVAENPAHVRVVHHQPNQGYGAAVWSGIQAAKYEYVFFTDADLQFELSELDRLVAEVPKHSVVIGYRAPRRDPLMRLLNAKGWNVLNRLLFGLKVRDIDCAFKLFDRELVANLPIRSRGAMMSAEMLIRLQRAGIIFKEVPVTHKPRQFGEATGAKPAVILRAFREMFQIYRTELGNPTILQIAKFGLVGVLNTALDLAAYFALTRTVPLASEYLLATKGFSFFLGTVSSFILNRAWTFQLEAKVKFAEVAKFYASVLSALILNVGATYVFYRLVGLSDLVAVLLATVVTFSWSFVLSRFWVFNLGPRPTESSRTVVYPA